MKSILPKFAGRLLLVLLLLAGGRASATHIYGADFTYTWVSGNTYTVTLTIYGDCSGSAFPTLNGATATVIVYNNTTQYTTLTLTQQGPGVEVTPVCAAQANNTVCSISSSTIPGVKRYIYATNVTLNTASANWRFRFDGTMSGSGAGRSNSITNIVSGTTMALEATLNNTAAAGGHNSNPAYTTIPTPFFCVNKPANYNPGTVDADGDALSFTLVAGLLPNTGTVTYQPTFSAIHPITTSNLVFGATTGQLSFTPTNQEKDLVVSKVTETRGATVVGTSMREMTFVMLACNNNPPGGHISSPGSGINLSTDSLTANVCQSQGIVTFNINPTDLDGDNINVSAAGLPAGSVFFIANNNTTAPTGSFSWNIATATPGTYNFYITYTDDGCPLSSKQTQVYTIIVQPNPTLTFTLTSAATCIKKAVFTLTPGNAPPYVINVSGNATQTFTGVTGPTVDSLLPGTYTFSITNANNCFHDTTVTIAPPPSPHATSSVANPVCFGASTGSITTTGFGGLSPYQYALGGGTFSATNTFTGLAAGPYTIHVKDANGCVLDTVITVINPADIHIAVATTKPPCNHFQNGAITLVASGSVGPYMYALGNMPYTFGTSGTFSGLFSGNYPVHVKNSLGCIKDSVVVLPDSVKIMVTALPITNVLCNGDSTGAVSISVTGAYPPDVYALNAGTFTSVNTFTGLPAGTYLIHVHDTDLCYLDTAITITQPTPVVATGSVLANVTCYGGANGGIQVTGTGGVNPYTYSNNGGTFGGSNIFVPLPAGTDTLRVKDANGCTKSAVVTITQPTQIVIGYTYVMPQCSYSADGSFTLTGSGGTPGTTGYTFSVDAATYTVSGTFTGLLAGSHTLHVKDANGCIRDSMVTLPAPARIVPVASVKQSTCSTLGDGRVTLTGSGGTPGYTYAKGVGAYSATNVFSALAAGPYTFHVKDSHGCIADTIITISDSLHIYPAVAVTNVLCYSFSTGVLTITGTGGQSPYTFAQGVGAYGTSGTFSALTAGTYALHVKDNNGCIHDTSVTVTQPARIVPSAVVVNELCYGGTNASITMSATGGVSPYRFANGVGAYNPATVFSGLTAGLYTIHTQDTNGCIIDTALTITQPTPLAFTLVVTNVLCNGGSTGTVTVNATGGTPAYTYASDGNTFGTASLLGGLNVGAHAIHLKDANGCTKDTNVTLTQPAVLNLGFTATQPLCNLGSDGTITITGTGGTTPYQFAINAGIFQSGGAFTGLAAGTYIMHIKDANGCTKDSTTIIGQPTAIVPAVLVHRPRCTPLVNGAVTITATGGTPGYTYAVGGGTYQASTLFTNLPSGPYTFHVKDSHNCIHDTTFTISDSIFVHATSAIVDANCYNDSTGTITVTPTGGNTPYTYAVNTNPYAAANPLIHLRAGTYILHVRDSNGCILDTSVVIGQPTRIVPTAVLTQPQCYAGSDGNIVAGASGGIPGYIYAIGAGTFSTNNTFSTLTAGNYIIHVKDAHNCPLDTAVTLGQPTKLIITSLTLFNNK